MKREKNMDNDLTLAVTRSGLAWAAPRGFTYYTGKVCVPEMYAGDAKWEIIVKDGKVFRTTPNLHEFRGGTLGFDGLQDLLGVDKCYRIYLMCEDLFERNCERIEIILPDDVPVWGYWEQITNGGFSRRVGIETVPLLHDKVIIYEGIPYVVGRKRVTQDKGRVVSCRSLIGTRERLDLPFGTMVALPF